jgi:hypothetical protein
LNSGDVLQARLSDFERLKKASDAQLKKWRLIGGGMGVNWEVLNEDLSLRGFIRDSVQHETLGRMTVRRSGMTIKSRGVAMRQGLYFPQETLPLSDTKT